MPANLPPQYFEAEKRYREARTTRDKLKCLEEMLTIMPKHKGTDKLRADLRRRISKLKDMGQARKGPGRRPPVYFLEKEGAGQVALLGLPNTGKSSLLAALTNAQPVIADYPFTTRIPLAGMMTYENVQIQLIDTPPVSPDYLEPWYPDLLRRADAWLLVVSLAEGEVLDQVEQAEAPQSIWGAEHDARLAAGVPKQRPAAAEKGRTRHVWDNPVLWREIRTWAYGRKILVIKLAYDAKTDMIDLVVRDYGCGIPADKLPHIFDSFFTTKSGPDASGKGGRTELIVPVGVDDLVAAF